MRAMPPEAFQINGQPGVTNNVHILNVAGPITSSTSTAFQDAVKATTAPLLILNLTEVPSVDSVAVGALVRAFVSCHKAGRKLALVGLTHRVRNVLELTGVAPLFECYASVAEAERAVQ